MGFRFSKRIRVLPGVTLNLSKSGVSTSIGPRGAKLTVGGRRGARMTVGIPGTGLSYTETGPKKRWPPASQSQVDAQADCEAGQIAPSTRQRSSRPERVGRWLGRAFASLRRIALAVLIIVGVVLIAWTLISRH